LAQNTKTTQKVVNGLIGAAATELAKINAAGGPEHDPHGEHHQKEVKAILERAARVAGRLPGKLAEKALQTIYRLAGEAGVTLVP